MSRRKQRRECEDGCGSRRFHEGDDGYTYCSNGHRQSELGAAVAEDTGEFVIRGNKVRGQSSDAESVTSKATGLSGAKAFERYLLCLQLVLRKQLRWLVDMQKLPAELETVVWDLWALRLQKVQDRMTYESETDTEAQSSQMFSSQSERDSDSESTNLRRSRHADRRRKGLNLTENLCLMYHGMLLLRIDITVADLLEWVNSGRLLFYSAAKAVPLKMREPLPGEFQDLLSPHDLLAPETLHTKVFELTRLLTREFGMTVPEINQPLILYHWVVKLALPLEVHVATQRLTRMLDVKFQFAVNAMPRTNVALRLPEVRLMALVVISTKMLFPFDEVRRYPRSSKDFSALEMDWNAWFEVRTQQQNADQKRGAPLTFENAFSMSEEKSLNLAHDQLDRYLDWYENVIASEDARQHGRAGKDAQFRQSLFAMFPASKGKAKVQGNRPEGDLSNDASVEALTQTQQTLHPKRIVPDEATEAVLRPGSSYLQYKTAEDLDGVVKKFYEEAGRLAGYSLRGLVRAVFAMERQVMREQSLAREMDG